MEASKQDNGARVRRSFHPHWTSHHDFQSTRVFQVSVLGNAVIYDVPHVSIKPPPQNLSCWKHHGFLVTSRH
ncbi:unnamed protein product [Notodromas monacha]|uniref:Uncharacterized protein n=1 Tax=Notodromas monacha TaxID=399045 RepID=A0A7R9GGL8_9CRUS|nr:unnamed protein product [Notodromas monacha]CAG0920546.1 unnamed protein product [Notodromas monacha]